MGLHNPLQGSCEISNAKQEYCPWRPVFSYERGLLKTEGVGGLVFFKDIGHKKLTGSRQRLKLLLPPLQQGIQVPARGHPGVLVVHRFRISAALAFLSSSCQSVGWYLS